jgi:hypothetical protein
MDSLVDASIAYTHSRCLVWIWARSAERESASRIRLRSDRGKPLPTAQTLQAAAGMPPNTYDP